MAIREVQSLQPSEESNTHNVQNLAKRGFTGPTDLSPVPLELDVQIFQTLVKEQPAAGDLGSYPMQFLPEV